MSNYNESIRTYDDLQLDIIDLADRANNITYFYDYLTDIDGDDMLVTFFFEHESYEDFCASVEVRVDYVESTLNVKTNVFSELYESNIKMTVMALSKNHELSNEKFQHFVQFIKSVDLMLSLAERLIDKNYVMSELLD